MKIKLYLQGGLWEMGCCKFKSILEEVSSEKEEKKRSKEERIKEYKKELQEVVQMAKRVRTVFLVISPKNNKFFSREALREFGFLEVIPTNLNKKRSTFFAIVKDL